MTLDPAWIGATAGAVEAATAAALLYQGIRGARNAAGEEFGRLLDEVLDLPAEELQARIGQAKIAELVGNAWDAAARTNSEQKRWILAQIVVAGLRGDMDDAIVDPLPIMLRTVQVLEPPDLRLLVLIATPRPGEGQLAGSFLEGFWHIEDLERAWPGSAQMMRPMLSVLLREGLIEDRGIGTYDCPQAYSLTTYGRQFLRFLPAAEAPALGRAALVAVRSATTEIVVRNVGLAPARDVRAAGPFDEAGAGLLMNGEPDPFDLDPGVDVILAVRPPKAAHPPPVIELRWTDGAGDHHIEVGVAV